METVSSIGRICPGIEAEGVNRQKTEAFRAAKIPRMIL